MTKGTQLFEAASAAAVAHVALTLARDKTELEGAMQDLHMAMFDLQAAVILERIWQNKAKRTARPKTRRRRKEKR